MSSRKLRGRTGRIFWLLAAVAMIVAVMPLAGATAGTADAPQVVNLIVDGGNDSTTWVDIGEVQVWDDGSELYVKYVVDVAPWCLTATHVDIDDIAVTKKNLPKVGKFTFKADFDPCVTEHMETISMTDLPETFKIAAHADAFIDGGFDVVDQVLPDTWTMKLTRPSLAYVNVHVWDDPLPDPLPVPDGPYLGWCADEHNGISLNTMYTVAVSSSYTDGDIDYGNIKEAYRQYLPNVNWVINNTDGYTMTQVQNVIWALLGDRNPPTSGAESILYTEALTHGDFVPECGESFLVIMATSNSAKQTMVFQTTFAELGVPCEDREETAWAGLWMENADGTGDFEDQFDPLSSWSGYFMYTAEPVVMPEG